MVGGAELEIAAAGQLGGTVETRPAPEVGGLLTTGEPRLRGVLEVAAQPERLGVVLQPAGQTIPGAEQRLVSDVDRAGARVAARHEQASRDEAARAPDGSTTGVVPSGDLSNPAIVVGQPGHGQEGTAQLVLLLRREVFGLDDVVGDPGECSVQSAELSVLLGVEPTIGPEVVVHLPEREGQQRQTVVSVAVAQHRLHETRAELESGDAGRSFDHLGDILDRHRSDRHQLAPQFGELRVLLERPEEVGPKRRQHDQRAVRAHPPRPATNAERRRRRVRSGRAAPRTDRRRAGPLPPISSPRGADRPRASSAGWPDVWVGERVAERRRELPAIPRFTDFAERMASRRPRAPQRDRHAAGTGPAPTSAPGRAEGEAPDRPGRAKTSRTLTLPTTTTTRGDPKPTHPVQQIEPTADLSAASEVDGGVLLLERQQPRVRSAGAVPVEHVCRVDAGGEQPSLQPSNAASRSESRSITCWDDNTPSTVQSSIRTGNNTLPNERAWVTSAKHHFDAIDASAAQHDHRPARPQPLVQLLLPAPSGGDPELRIEVQEQRPMTAATTSHAETSAATASSRLL